MIARIKIDKINGRRIVDRPNRSAVEEKEYQAEKKEYRHIRRQRVATAVERNRNLPRLASRFWELRHGFFGVTSMPRWVVLDQAEATLSLWDQPPPEDIFHKPSEQKQVRSVASNCSLFPALGLCGDRFPPKAPRRVLSLLNLKQVGSDCHLRHLFLRFEGEEQTLVLTTWEPDFTVWMATLRAYGQGPQLRRQESHSSGRSSTCSGSSSVPSSGHSNSATDQEADEPMEVGRWPILAHKLYD